MADSVALMLLRITRGRSTNHVAVIHIPRSAELVVDILGVAKAGMAFAAVDTEELPLERLYYILGDTKSDILLTTHHPKESPRQSGIHRIFVEDIMMARLSFHTPVTSVDRNLIDDDDVLALVYTSGSTGKPKGSFLYDVLVMLIKSIAPVHSHSRSPYLRSNDKSRGIREL